MLISGTLISCLEDETADFTSFNHYPDFPKDSTKVTDPGDGDGENPQPSAPCSDSTFFVERSEKFNSLFTRYGGGWTGGDATYSILLPDGRTLWIFGDTFLGVVNPDRSRPGTGLARNTFVIQDGDQLTTYVKPDGSAFISPENKSWWYWPTDGTVFNDTLQVLLSAFRSTGEGGSFGFEYASIDLALFTLPDLSLISIERRFTDPTIAFGSCVLESDDYIYIYGAEKEGLHKYANVARAPGGDLRNDWEYFNGSNWVSDLNQSAGSFNDVSEQFAVFEDNGHYYMVSSHHLLGKQIYLFDAPTPVGPWGNKRTIYCTPESGGNRWTYNAFVHPQFTENGEILISYNVNSFNFSELFKNADYYRPYFIRVGNWKQ
ncbi:hypothetical protein BH23BAC1_BH23BAC1_22130 [soil metagenome]